MPDSERSWLRNNRQGDYLQRACIINMARLHGDSALHCPPLQCQSQRAKREGVGRKNLAPFHLSLEPSAAAPIYEGNHGAPLSLSAVPTSTATQLRGQRKLPPFSCTIQGQSRLALVHHLAQLQQILVLLGSLKHQIKCHSDCRCSSTAPLSL